MNVLNLVQSIQTLNAYDAFRPRFSPENWRVVGSYLIRREMKGGDVLIYQGDSDRTMYLLESGTLQVYVRGTATSAAKIALLRAGSIVGEPALFGETMRMAVAAIVNTGAADIRTAVGFRTGPYEPDFAALETDNTIVLPWDGEVIIGRS